VSIEKGPFLAPWDAVHILENVSSAGNWNVMLTECGSSFGYDRRVVDFPGFEVMRETGFPLLFDASRSLETPIRDARSESGLVGSLAEAALAVGVDGISLVVHDGASEEVRGVASSPIDDLSRRLRRLKEIERVVKTI
jgi:2-dehydro-3-deoxyphosphooctonate aldolase (KDO 8-P synthase)